MKRDRKSRRHLEVRGAIPAEPQRAAAGHPSRLAAARLTPQDDGERVRQRIDKWLWHARVVRTRGDAAALVGAGFVRLNGKRVTAAGQAVRRGDVLTVALDRSVRVIRVAGFCERRGAAPAAQALYREMTNGSGAEASAADVDSAKVSPPAGGED